MSLLCIEDVVNILEDFVPLKNRELTVTRNSTKNFKDACDKMEKHYENIRIYYQKVFLDHDGYDRYGPESNIWDIIVLIINETKFQLDIWHGEDWFDGDFKFYLEKSIDIDNFESINRFLMMAAENKLYSQFFRSIFDTNDKKNFDKKYPDDYYLGTLDKNGTKSFISLYKKNNDLHYKFLD